MSGHLSCVCFIPLDEHMTKISKLRYKYLHLEFICRMRLTCHLALLYDILAGIPTASVLKRINAITTISTQMMVPSSIVTPLNAITPAIIHVPSCIFICGNIWFYPH